MTDSRLSPTLMSDPTRSTVEDTIEAELKLAGTPDQISAIAAGDTLRAATATPAKRQRLDSVYYDTPDRRLSARGVSFRVRAKNGKFEQTVKTEGEGTTLTRRGEWTVPLDGAQPDPALFTQAEVRSLLGLILPGELQPIVASRIDRTVIIAETDPEGTPQPGGAVRIEVAVDGGRLETLDRSEPVAEIELELMSGPASGLFGLARRLNRESPLLPLVDSKAARGFRLAKGEAPAVAVTAGKPKLSADMPAIRAFRSVADDCLGQIAANLPRVLASAALESPPLEPVHQMRVGIRRFRSALSLFRPVLPFEAAEWAKGTLSALADTLGPVRDLDVFTNQLLPPVTEALGEAATAPLARAADRARKAARAEGLAALDGGRATDAILALEAWVDGGQLTIGSGSQTLPLSTLAERLLERRHKGVRRLGRGFATASIERRHEVRIAVKKLRYAVEFFSSLYPPTRVRPYRKALANLQEELGHLQDVATAEMLVARMAAQARGAHKAPLALAGGQLLGWYNHAVVLGDAALVARWRAFRDETPYWQAA